MYLNSSVFKEYPPLGAKHKTSKCDKTVNEL